MTLIKDGYLGPWAGRPDRREIAARARHFNYFDTNGDGVCGAPERAAARSAKGKGATPVESGA